VPKAAALAQRPRALNDVEAASVPVVAVTAWQMLFECAHATAGQSVLVHGGPGNVGGYAVQLASQAGRRVFATATGRDAAYVQRLGATRVIDYQTTQFEDVVSSVDIVIDTVGGDTLQRSYAVVAPGGIVVSIIWPFPSVRQHPGVREAFLIVEVTTARLNAVADLFDRRKLVANVGAVLPLEQARNAHEMLSRGPRSRGKIVLRMKS
jgi:NADPH:quinone reductase-like Zn-dependent oxidoreductase